jgi:hypothetical protein
MFTYMPTLQIDVSDEIYYKLGMLKNRVKVKTWPQFMEFIGNNAVIEENRISYWTDEQVKA